VINFEQWFRQQDFYTNMMFIYGNRLFDHDGDFYRLLTVHIAYQAWQDRQAELKDLMQRIGPEVPNNPTSDEIEAEQIKNKNLQIKGLQNRIDKALPFLDRAYKFTKSTSCCLAILDAKEALRGEHENTN